MRITTPTQSTSTARAAFHIGRSRQLTVALEELIALQSLLPPKKATTLCTSLRVIREEMDLALAALRGGGARD
jgi:hypothetical protein